MIERKTTFRRRYLGPQAKQEADERANDLRRNGFDDVEIIDEGRVQRVLGTRTQKPKS